MGKRKKKGLNFWEIDWDRVKSWDDLFEIIRRPNEETPSKLGDILKSDVGNRDEDIIDDNAGGDISDTSDVDLAG
jgi:hypothetical protein